MGDEQQEGHYWKDSLKREGLSQMMFGYGDDPLPLEESMDLVEELVHQFLTDLCTKGKKIAGKKRLKVEDILWIVRKNKKMVARGKTLLKMNVEINQAKSMLDVGKRGKGVQ